MDYIPVKDVIFRQKWERSVSRSCEFTLYHNFGGVFGDLVPIPGITRREVEDLYREYFSDQQQAIHCVLVIGIRLL